VERAVNKGIPIIPVRIEDVGQVARVFHQHAALARCVHLPLERHLGPRNLTDGNDSTAWVEGVTARVSASLPCSSLIRRAP
jgi:hypothetical protein